MPWTRTYTYVCTCVCVYSLLEGVVEDGGSCGRWAAELNSQEIRVAPDCNYRCPGYGRVLLSFDRLFGYVTIIWLCNGLFVEFSSSSPNSLQTHMCTYVSTTSNRSLLPCVYVSVLYTSISELWSQLFYAVMCIKISSCHTHTHTHTHTNTHTRMRVCSHHLFLCLCQTAVQAIGTH